MKREIQESSSVWPAEQQPALQVQSGTDDTAAIRQSLPVKSPSPHAADRSALCCTGLEQSAVPQGPSTSSASARRTLWSSRWWLLQLYMELKTQSLGREKTAALRASPHVSTGRLVSSSGTEHASTPGHSFKIVDDFFFLLFSVMCFFFKCIS